MKFLLFTFGSHGDVHPFIAIARALARAGHHAVVLTHPHFERDVSAAGVPFEPMGRQLDYDSLIRHPDLMHRHRGGNTVMRTLFDAAPETARQASDALARHAPDACLAHQTSFAARWVCEERCVPCAGVGLAPIALFLASDLVPPLQRSPGRLSFALGRFASMLLTPVAEHVYRGKVGRIRAEIGLRQTGGGMIEAFRGGELMLGMWSPAFRPPHPHDPPTARICGFPWYDGGEANSIGPELRAFLDAGNPPIVFSLGTAAVYHASDFYELAIGASRQLNRRAVLLIGHASEPLRGLPKEVLAVPYAPFGALLPRACATVHHGGIGSTAQALRAGRPQVVVPHAHDQFNNAVRVVNLGCGAMVARHRLTMGRLATALASVLDDPSVCANSADLGRTLTHEDGAVVAADALMELARKRTGGSSARGREAETNTLV